MPRGRKRFTQEQAIQCLIDVHGDTYDYSKSVYTKASEKLTVICRKHGEFKITYANHKVGQGCVKCGKLRLADALRKTKEQFVADAMSAHGNKFDYSKAEYVDSNTKMLITCPVHGEFLQTPFDHLKSFGCPSCGAHARVSSLRSSTEAFIEKAKQVHGETYDYSKVHYQSAGSGVIIICEKHGDFEQRARNHLYGYGCPRCSGHGFLTTRAGWLYVLADGLRVKVGITNRTPQDRLREINEGTMCFKIFKEYYFESGRDCIDVETAVLKILRSLYQNSAGNFSGVSESFENASVDFVVSLVEERISSISS